MRLLLPADVVEIKRLVDGGQGYRPLMAQYSLPWSVVHAIATGAIPQPAAAAAQLEVSPCLL